MDVCFVTPAWRRYEVTRLALAQRAHLHGELAARGLEAHSVVIADDDNLDIAREFGFHTIELDNSALGRRCNAGLEFAYKSGAKYVVPIGSDDWVHASLFDRLPQPDPEMPMPGPGRPVFWSPAPEMLTGTEIAIVDLLGGRLRHCRARGRFGVIPWVMPHALLSPSRGRPVKDHIMRGLDGSMATGLRIQPNLVFHDPHPLARVDFKSGTNITPYAGLTRTLGYGPEVYDPWTLLETLYPAHLVEMARQTHEELAR